MRNINFYLEKFLEISTWLATILVALGVVFSNSLIINMGIASFILIPVCRVIGLGINFYKEKDFQMSLIALFVFAIIFISFIFGLSS